MFTRRSYLATTAAGASLLGAFSLSGSGTSPLWVRQKHGNNPVIEGTSVLNDQAYPPTVICRGNKFYCIVKSAGRYISFTSTDGVHWEETSPWFVPRSAIDETIDKLSYPLLRYDPTADITHLYTSYRESSSGEWYTIHSYSNPVRQFQFNTDPLFDPAAAASKFGISNHTFVTVSDVIRTSNGFYFYGVVGGGSDSVIWVSEGSDWNDIDPDAALIFGSDIPNLGTLLQSPSVIKSAGQYYLTFTHGKRGDQPDERSIWAVSGDSLVDFGDDATEILQVGPSGSWDGRRVYAAQWLVRQDGEFLRPLPVNDSARLYYSGLDVGHHHNGQTGIAVYPNLV